MSKVLIIEDDPIVARAYQRRLAKEGYQVDICPDGQSGFYRIHELNPEAILLDLMLPKMHGVEILRKIRAQRQFQKTPVIVLTNAYVPNLIHEAFQAGANQVFNKATLTPRQIVDAVRNAMLSAAGEPTAQPQASPAASWAPETQVSDFHDPALFAEPPFHGRAEEASTQAGRPSTPTPASTPNTTPEPLQFVDDAEFQAELLRTFMENAPDTLAGLRQGLQELLKSQDGPARLEAVLDLYRKVHALTGAAGMAGLYTISQMAAALEVLLKELHEKPRNINPSTLRTVAQAIDFIGELFAKGVEAEQAQPSSTAILVVDDEILSRRAIAYALEKADLKCVSVEDPCLALKLASENPFSLIFLDVQMPGMDGFELCSKIRTLPTHKHTPIIFVTSLTDFKSRAKSTLSGGNDFIAKPFMFIELSVKALTYVLRGRISNPQRAAA
jgi:DNA-binding response OmpR family regulator/HPt (histidine-containing phosphotransfer) domain-containing protein